MDVTIYTSGSSEFLEIVLNATAMITGSGSAEDLARVGALIGLLLLVFQAVHQNRPISFQQAGLALVLYMMFYGPTSTVVIEDTVSNQARVVDNVPLGPAAVGSFISTISYNVTQIVEQAVSTPEMTKYGLFSSLTTLAKVRDTLRNPTALDAFHNHKASLGWDFPRSVQEYMTYCTLNPVMLRTDKTVEQLYRTSGIENIISAKSTSQNIYWYDGSTNPPPMKTCTEAQSLISTEMKAIVTDVFEEIMVKGFATEYKAGKIRTAAEVQAATQSGIDVLAEAAKSAQDFILTSIIQPVFNTARVDAMRHWQEDLAATALQDSMNQQEIQWAGKGDSFKNYMRPMIGFFEGLLYAMTPFMAFALMLGSKGYSVLAKYLVLPLAVGLWLPLLAVVNAFTLWYASAEISALAAGYDPTSVGFSMLQLSDFDRAISKALGIGGLLASSVPPLALFIVSGSAMVANGIMSQASSAEKFQSEAVAPRAMKEIPPVLQGTAAYTSDQLTPGASVTGAKSLAEKIDLGEVGSSAVKSADSAYQSSTTQLQDSLRAGTQDMYSTSVGRQSLQQMGEAIGSSSVLSSNSEYTQARQNLKALGYSDDQVNQLTGAAAIDASGGVSIGMFAKASAGMKISAGSATSNGHSVSQRDEQSQAAMTRLAKSVQAVDKNDLTFTTSDAYLKSSQAAQSASTAQEVAKVRSAAMESRQAFEKASSFSKSVGVGQQVGIAELAADSQKQGGGDVHDFTQNLVGKDEATFRDYQQELKNPLLNRIAGSDDHRKMIAGIRAMIKNDRFHEFLASKWNPLELNPAQYDAYQNEGLSKQNTGPSIGQLDGKLSSSVAGVSGQIAGERDMHYSGKDDQSANARERVSSEVANNTSGVLSAYSRERDGVDQKGAEGSLSSVISAGGRVRQAGHLGVGGIENATSKAGRTADYAGTKNMQPSHVEAKIQQHREFGLQQGLTPAQAEYRALVKMGYGPDDKKVQSAAMTVQAEAAAIAAAAGPQYSDYSKGVVQSLYDGAAGTGASNSDAPVLRQVAQSRSALEFAVAVRDGSTMRGTSDNADRAGHHAGQGVDRSENVQPAAMPRGTNDNADRAGHHAGQNVDRAENVQPAAMPVEQRGVQVASPAKPRAARVPSSDPGDVRSAPDKGARDRRPTSID